MPTLNPPEVSVAPLVGLRGITHGGARVLTVMSPAGAAAVGRAIRPGADIIASTAPGRLSQYQEKRAGALAALVEQYAIAVLEKRDWDRRKRDWGEAVYR